MDLALLIEIVIVIIVVYFVLKFIVSPIIRAILGVIIFLVVIYLLQRFFGFNLSQILAPFGVSLNSSKWNLNLDWLLGPANYYIDQIKTFLSSILQNTPKFIKK